MKVFCLYTVVDIKTGMQLASGRKRKDFACGSVRYIKDMVIRCFPFFWRKIECLYRTVEIKGRQCLIYYWCDGVKGHKNIVYPFGNEFFLSGNIHYYNPANYMELIEELGVM